MDTLTIIQMADTGIDAGTDLCKHKYSVEEVDLIVKETKRQQELETLNKVILNLSHAK